MRLSLVEHYWYNIESKRKQRSCFSTFNNLSKEFEVSVSVFFFGKKKNCGCSEKMFDDTSCPRSVLLNFWRNLMIIVEPSCNLQSCSNFDDGFVTLHHFSNFLRKKTQARREAKAFPPLVQQDTSCVKTIFQPLQLSAAFFSFTLPLCKCNVHFINFLLCEWGKGLSSRI